jgi:hypothetical protein
MEAKEIEEFPNYKIYPNGTVFSNHKNGFIKLQVGTTGYIIFRFKDKDKQRTIKIHRLVAKAFVSNHDNKPHVNHINGIKTDNRFENLEWVTKSENAIHAHKKGLSVISKLNRSINSERCKLRVGKNNEGSKKVIDVVSGLIYDSAKIAAEENGINPNTLYHYLTDRLPNKTNLRYM